MLLSSALGSHRRFGANGQSAQAGVVEHHRLAVGIAHDVGEHELAFPAGAGGFPVDRRAVIPREIDHGFG